VNEIFEKRRLDAADALEARRAEAFAAVPELRDICLQLRAVSAELVGLTARGDADPDSVGSLRRRHGELMQKRRELLDGAGLPPDYLEIKRVCPLCGDNGFVGSEMCRCYLAELRRYAYMTSPLAASQPDADFSAFDLGFYSAEPDGTGISPRRRMEETLSACRRFCENFSDGGNSLLFVGPTGLGKTFLSACIARELLGRGVDVVYDTAHGIFSALERDRFSHTEQTQAAVDRLLSCELLIIDDLGSEFVTAFTVSALYFLINHRLLSSSRMIISTNCELSELEKLYSARITSRLIDKFDLCRFCGEDIRLQKRRRGM